MKVLPLSFQVRAIYAVDPLFCLVLFLNNLGTKTIISLHLSTTSNIYLTSHCVSKFLHVSSENSTKHIKTRAMKNISSVTSQTLRNMYNPEFSFHDQIASKSGKNPFHHDNGSPIFYSRKKAVSPFSFI